MARAIRKLRSAAEAAAEVPRYRANNVMLRETFARTAKPSAGVYAELVRRARGLEEIA